MILKRRLPFSSKLFAGLSVACALIAFAIVRGLELRLSALHPPSGAPVPVVVATGDAARGSTIVASMVSVKQIPLSFAPDGALTTVPQATGRVLMADIAAGEILTQTRLAPESGGPVAALVPPGLRAVVVVADIPPGDLRPGDRIDLLAAFDGNDAHTETVGRDLQVLGVEAGQAATTDGFASQLSGADAGSWASLLLLVDSSEAERVAFAQAFGALSVAIEPVVPDAP